MGDHDQEFAQQHRSAILAWGAIVRGYLSKYDRLQRVPPLSAVKATLHALLTRTDTRSLGKIWRLSRSPVSGCTRHNVLYPPCHITRSTCSQETKKD